jgi:hypothetical protein
MRLDSCVLVVYQRSGGTCCRAGLNHENEGRKFLRNVGIQTAGKPHNHPEDRYLKVFFVCSTESLILYITNDMSY